MGAFGELLKGNIFICGESDPRGCSRGRPRGRTKSRGARSWGALMGSKFRFAQGLVLNKSPCFADAMS